MYQSSEFKQSFTIPYYANLHCQELGHDSEKHCFDKTHFKNYGPVEYSFNELGFRTKPLTQFRGDEILAIGDSFTLGLGVNAQDRWTNQLEKLLDYPVLNFSLNGASNDWIARKANQLLQYFRPRALVIHWTFSHRRERPFLEWTDDERTECEPWYTEQENLKNWIKNYRSINFTPAIHSVIPGWHDNFDYAQYPVAKPIPMLDLARDGFHYGIKTHRYLAETFTSLLADV